MNEPIVATAVSWTFAVQHPRGELGREASRVLGPLASGREPTSTYVLEGPAPDGAFELYLDDRPVGRSNHAHAIVNLLVWSINREVAARTDRYVLVHGGCVSIGGRSAVITGPSGAGKSTLVTALVRSGCTYLTDEAVAFDQTPGVVAPFTRCITLKSGSWPLFPDLRPPDGVVLPPFTTEQWHVDPRQVGAMASPGDRAKVQLILRLKRTQHDGPELVPISRGETLMFLLNQGLNTSADPARAMEVLTGTVRQAATYELRYRSGVEAAALVRDRLADLA